MLKHRHCAGLTLFFFPLPSLEIVRAMTHVINQGMAMYWGTSRWSAMEIMVKLGFCFKNFVFIDLIVWLFGFFSFFWEVLTPGSSSSSLTSRVWVPWLV